MIVIPDIMNVSEEGSYELPADVLDRTVRAVDESHLQPCFFHDLPEDRIIRAFVLFEVTSWREPFLVLFVPN